MVMVNQIILMEAQEEITLTGLEITHLTLGVTQILTTPQIISMEEGSVAKSLQSLSNR